MAKWPAVVVREREKEREREEQRNVSGVEPSGFSINVILELNS